MQSEGGLRAEGVSAKELSVLGEDYRSCVVAFSVVNNVKFLKRIDELCIYV
jgi:hypothetical protein